MLSLKDVLMGSVILPPRILIYGRPGVGKTTFASKASNPIFIQTEDGADVAGAARFPKAESYEQVIEAIDLLANEKHDHGAVVIDTLDWLEPLVYEKTVEDGKQNPNFKTKNISNIEDFGYGKGYEYADMYFRTILDKLNNLRSAKGMAVIMLAHSEMKRYEDPASEGYDRWMPKLKKKAAATCMEYCDIVGFANYYTSMRQVDKGFGQTKNIPIGDGSRVLYTQEKPSFIAKSRYDIPHELPFSWADLVAAIQPVKELKNGTN